LTQSCETFSLFNNQPCLSFNEINMAKLVIIDDEAAILELMTKLCKAAGHQVFGCTTGIDGIAAIRSNQPDLVIVDLRIGDVNGLDLVSMCRDQFPNTAVIMVTGHGSVETAVEAMRLGAFDYLTKPFDLGDLIKTVNQALQRNGVAAATPTALPSSTLRSASSSKLIGHSDALQRIFDIVRRVANNDSPVLLEGEFGVGKHMVARALHEASRRSKCLLQGTAMQRHARRRPRNRALRPDRHLQPCAGGTIHLAEVNQLPARIQAQLNTFLDETQSKKGWSNGSSGADFRLIVSSTVSLEESVKAGKFREDLYYKLSVVPLKIPPLRNRREDVKPLVEHFLKELAERTDDKTKTIDPAAVEFLEKYNWPGNVSELRNAIERACAFAENDRIKPSDLPTKVTQQIEVPTPSSSEGITKLPIGSTLDDFIKGQERVFIQETLKYNSGSREKTASMLGVSIATLYRKMGLNVERKTTT
jgi:DNA-binding NtrC family response regulator